MKNEKVGYWTIAAQKHLKAFTLDSNNLDELDNIDIAGKAGRFLGAIRGNGKIENRKKIEKIGNTIGIKPKELHKIILPELENASDGMVELIKDSSGEITGIAEYVFTNNNVLELTGKIFAQFDPSDIEKITLQTLENTKKIPMTKSELFNNLTDYGYKDKNIEFSLLLQSQFKLVQILNKLDAKNPIISNEYVWGENHEKIAYALNCVSIDNKHSLKEIITNIQSYQGIPSEELMIGNQEMFSLAKKIGMIDPINVLSERGLSKEFSFSSDLSSNCLNNDIMDDVKVLLASIRFGERYTDYSTIQNPVRFLESLINNDSVGPHSANLTDYILLEKKGIVSVVNQTKTKNSFYGGTYTKQGPCLKLIKKDVAEKVLELIKNPEYSKIDDEFSEFSFISNTGSYLSAEENRISMAELSEPVQEAHNMMIRCLRDEEI